MAAARTDSSLSILSTRSREELARISSTSWDRRSGRRSNGHGGVIKVEKVWMEVVVVVVVLLDMIVVVVV